MPEVAMEMIFDFIKPAGFEDEPEAHAPVRITKKKYVPTPSIAEMIRRSLSLTKPPTFITKKKQAPPLVAAAALPKDGMVELDIKPPVPFDMNTLYEPGCKHAIPVLVPSEHLT
eukprot:scaffold19347_cov76-Amphora_coffeaeformis.AAC.1